MSSYLVLARKWRPQRFADLVGQEHITKTLSNAIAQNRVAHAFLFTGSRGVGKTSTARLFAKALNCANLQDGEPCNVCASCTEITEGHSLDVIEIDGASNRGINEIRELREAVRYAPTRDRYKIYIIDEVHMLTMEAFNALLKTLEEPPAHAIFIFATTDANKVPVTILSRCQRYDFKRIQIQDMVQHLGAIAKAEGIVFEDAALQLIARSARGGVRDALSAMDQIIAFAAPPISSAKAAEILGVASRETLLAMAQAVLQGNVHGAIEALAQVDRYGQSLSQFAFDLLEFLRDITLIAASQSTQSDFVELSASERQEILPHLAQQNMERLQRLFSLWYECSELIPRSLSPKLLMEMTLVKMCQTQVVLPLGPILHRLDALAKAVGQNIPDDALERAQTYLGTTLPLAVPSPQKVTAPAQSTASLADAEKKKIKLDPVPQLEAAPRTQPSEVAPVSVGAAKPAVSVAEPPKPQPVSEADDDLPDDIMETLAQDFDAAPALARGSNSVQKQFAVLASSTHNADAAPSQWESFVKQLPTILSAIMVQGVVVRFDAQGLDIEFAQEYASILSGEHRTVLQEQLDAYCKQKARLNVSFKELAQGAESLAVQRKLKELQEQEAGIAAVRQDPVLAQTLHTFGVDPHSVRINIKPKEIQ